MDESLLAKVRREWTELVKKFLWAVVKAAIKKLDVLGYDGFMAYSFTGDERTTYHVIAERHLDICHVFGTKVEYYERNSEP